MSISSYRSTIERLHKDIADLEKRRGQENQKIAKLMGEISSIERSINKSTSVSSLQSKQQQIASKLKEVGQTQEKVADYTKKIGGKTGDLNSNLQRLESAEVQERNKNEAATKKRQDDELKRAKSITQETEKQSRLHSQLSSNRFVIDVGRLPLEIKVVIFAPSPQDLAPLRLDNEIREISVKLRASDFRDSVKIITCLATQPSDVLQALNEHKPHIVQFSGHGSDEAIAFVDPDGNTKLVTKDAIVQIMNTMSDNIRVVVFNTCFSSDQAQAVTQYVDAAIGMNDSIGDDAAKIFSAQFYSAIGFGRSIQNAFDQARVALMVEGIPEESTPQIFSREGIDLNQLNLVRPQIATQFGLLSHHISDF